MPGGPGPGGSPGGGNGGGAGGGSSAVMQLPGNLTLMEVSGQDRAPKKDYCQLVVTKDHVLFRRWIITLRVEAKHLRPVESKESHEDFLDDDSLQEEVERIFGLEVLNKAKRLCEGCVDWLGQMPLPIVLYIISFLDIVDIANLSTVNSFFREACNSDIIWEELFFRHNEDVTEDVMDLAAVRGWRDVFFSSRLHLRVMLNRRHRARKLSEGSGGSGAGDGEKSDADNKLATIQMNESLQVQSKTRVESGPGLGAGAGDR